METRFIGRLRRDVSRLALAVTGLYRRPDVPPTEVKRAIGLAVDLGVNVFATAPALGDSEQLCGETLRSLHVWERALLTTRIPPASAPHATVELLKDDEGEVFRDPLPRVFSPEYLEYRLERSLRATRLEIIGLALLEGWHDSWMSSSSWPEVLGAMAQLRRKGKVLHWGLALPAFSVPHCAAVLDEPMISAVAAPLCLWNAAAERLASAAAEREIAFFAEQVMGQGGLSGEITATSVFRHDDVRHTRFADPAGLIELSRRIAELAAFTKSTPPAAESSDAAREVLEAVRRDRSERECETLAELAVRFAISSPSVTAAVVGASSAAHVRGNAEAAARGALSARVLEPLRALIDRYRR
jgi:aryl-alcohol dehydrogenase-like predicted oxidoreductase